MNHHPFMFTGEQEAFRDSVRRIARSELAPHYLERAASEERPTEMLETLIKHGLLGLGVPEAHGGGGAGPIETGIAMEELARADVAAAYCVFQISLAGGFIAHHLADVEERGRLLAGLAEANILPCLALTEPGSGSDAAALRTTATEVEGGWVLNGEKTSVSFGPHADLCMAFATVDPARGPAGVTCFLVDLHDPTVSKQRFNDPGCKPIGRSAFAFENTFVPRNRVLGDVGTGFSLVMHEFEYTRALIGLKCVGLARQALEMTAGYVTERHAFGRPIGEFQGVSFVLAEHDTYVEAVRWLCYRALALREAGKSCNREAAMCKWWAPQVAVKAINDCIVLHGHVGWSDEMPLQSMLRDASAYQIGDGTPQIQKLVIARELLGRKLV